jgi:hypothetical protein
MKIKCVLLILIVIAFCEIKAQTIGLNFTAGVPSGEFKESMNKTGFGASLHATLWQTGPLNPVTLGLNVGYMNFGSDSRNTAFSETIPDVTVNVDRSYNLVNFHFLLQISPFSGPFVPYAEGLLGGSYLYTETSVKSERSNDNVASSVNFDDFAWSAGGGGGFLIKLVDKLGNDDTEKDIKLGSLWLDLKARYLFGTEAEYLQEGSVRIANGKATYISTKSKTDMLTFHLGVVLSLR